MVPYFSTNNPACNNRTTVCVTQTWIETGTSPTVAYYPNTVITWTRARTSNIIFKPPKNWRWYDVFRTPIEPKRLNLQVLAEKPLRKTQDRCSASQRRYHKRKQFVQRLHKGVN